MKRRTVLQTSCLTALMVCALLLVQCNNFIHELIPKEDWPAADDPVLPVHYTVSFDKNGGTTDASPAAKTVTPPAATIDALPAVDPIWASHAFEGWWTANGYGGNWGTQFTTSTPVTADIVVYAKWNPPPVYYTVTFSKNNSDSGSTEASPNTAGVAANNTVNPLPAPPTRTGYTFGGWNTAANGSGTAFTGTTPVSANITVYAQWTVNTYTVSFDRNGGTTDAIPAAKTVTPPATTIDALPTTDPFWAGHAFLGWWTANGYGGNWGTQFTTTTTVTADITIYAKWNPPPDYYTVTFNKNNSDSGCTEASPNTAGVAGNNTVNPLPTPPARLGYTFSGWNTAANGSGTVFTAATPVTANITVYAQWTLLPHYFTFTVRTTTANETFAIPTSGNLNGAGSKPYTWNIDWGDTQSEPANGSSSDTSAGIAHTYASPGDYWITIIPGGSTDAWLGAFGFYTNTDGANVQTNKDKVISLDSPLTLLMTRTQAQITAGTAPNNEWAYTFNNCKNPAFIMGPAFRFAAEWDTITTVGNYFACFMFSGCSGNAFTMNAVFNLPQGILTGVERFANGMFSYCNGDAFTMNTVFNLPQGITSTAGYFASGMFVNCNGMVFNMNSVFNLPPSISSVGGNFVEGIFKNCSGAAFKMNDVFNLPPGITNMVYNFAKEMFSNCHGAAFKMNDVFNLPQGIGSVDSYFAVRMFSDCYGDAFKMNDVFNLPPLITSVIYDFADGMFGNCYGASFTMNNVFKLPTTLTTIESGFIKYMFFNCYGAAFRVNSVFMFPLLTQAELDKGGVFENTFMSVAAVQTRTAASIINGNPDPSADKNTFGPSGAWTDYGSIHANWR